MRKKRLPSKREIWENIFLSPDEVKRRKLIRKRRSYQDWKEWYDFLKTNPSKEEILKRIFGTLDRKHAFGYYTHAVCSEESLQLLLEDEKNEEKITNFWKQKTK